MNMYISYTAVKTEPDFEMLNKQLLVCINDNVYTLTVF